MLFMQACLFLISDNDFQVAPISWACILYVWDRIICRGRLTILKFLTVLSISVAFHEPCRKVWFLFHHFSLIVFIKVWLFCIFLYLPKKACLLYASPPFGFTRKDLRLLYLNWLEFCYPNVTSLI